MATASSLSLGCASLARQSSPLAIPDGRIDGNELGGGGVVAGKRWSCDLPFCAGTNTKSKTNWRQITLLDDAIKRGRENRTQWRIDFAEGTSSSSLARKGGNAIANPNASGPSSPIAIADTARVRGADVRLGSGVVANFVPAAGSERKAGRCLLPVPVAVARYRSFDRSSDGSFRASAGAMHWRGIDGGDEGGDGGVVIEEWLAEEEGEEMVERLNGGRQSPEQQQEDKQSMDSSLPVSIGRRTALVVAGHFAATIASVSSTRGSWPSWRRHTDALADEGEGLQKEGIGGGELAVPSDTTEEVAVKEVANGSEGGVDSDTVAVSSAETSSMSEDVSGQPSDSPRVTNKVFLDIAIENEPIGRIVVGLYGQDAPIGAQRFTDLAVGKGGISYRRKVFDKITPSFIQNAGVRFNVSAVSADNESIAGGPSAEMLLEEMKQQQSGSRGAVSNRKGTVSLVAMNLQKDLPKQKLIARDGKLVVVEEPGIPDPNGTEFAILTVDAPELDATNVVVGRVLEGMDVVEKIANVPINRDNSQSPYFKIAKSIGDTRAKVAERGFNRPLVRVIVSRSGVLSN